jgi:uncharacterized protein
MLLEIRLSNFFSIQDEVSLDFRAGNIKTAKARELSDNVFEWDGEQILKTVGMYGPNASGKSNIIKAIRFCCRMILDSHGHNEGTVFNFVPFKFGGENTPSSFLIRFVLDEIEYEYSFQLTRTNIVGESLFHYPNGRRARVFVRDEKAGSTKAERYQFGDTIRKPLDVAENTSDKTLYLSRASQMDRELLKQIYHFFNERFLLGLVPLSSMRADELFKKNKELIVRALQMSDSDIVDVRSIHEKIDGTSFRFDVETGSSESFKHPIQRVRFETVHKHSPYHVFDLDSEESEGTRKLFHLLLRLVDVVKGDKVLMLDEFDSSLHQRIAEFVVSMVHASSCAQLLFTTHNTSLINLNKMRRDQIVFVNKNESGATEVYSLFDYKDFREHMDAEKGYRMGRFDAVPFVEDSSESLHQLVHPIAGDA